MNNLKAISGASVLVGGVPNDLNELTYEQFDDMLNEFYEKAASLKDFFSSVKYVMSRYHDDKTSPGTPESNAFSTTSIKPGQVFSKSDLIVAFKEKQLIKLDFGYIPKIIDGSGVL